MVCLGPTIPAPGFAAEIEAKPLPRIIKSHLPFYLLHPTLVETSKVSLIEYLTNKLNKLVTILVYLRWFTLLVILRTSFSPFTSITN